MFKSSRYKNEYRTYVTGLRHSSLDCNGLENLLVKSIISITQLKQSLILSESAQQEGHHEIAELRGKIWHLKQLLASRDEQSKGLVALQEEENRKHEVTMMETKRALFTEYEGEKKKMRCEISQLKRLMVTHHGAAMKMKRALDMKKNIRN